MSLIKSTIRMGYGQYCWDKLDLVIQYENTVTTLRLKDRKTAINIHQKLIILNSSDNTDDLTIDIDNREYLFTFQEWQAMQPAFKDWYELYTESIFI